MGQTFGGNSVAPLSTEVCYDCRNTRTCVNDSAGVHCTGLYVYFRVFLALQNKSKCQTQKDGIIMCQETVMPKSALIYSTRVSVLCFTVMLFA